MIALDERLLTVPEVAQRLRVGAETVRRWVRDGQLRGISMGDRAGWRIRESALETFLRERETRAS